MCVLRVSVLVLWCEWRHDVPIVAVGFGNHLKLVTFPIRQSTGRREDAREDAKQKITRQKS